MKKLNLIAITGLLVFGLTAHAKIDTSKIICTYNSAAKGQQTMTFEAPAGVNLSAYPPSHDTVPLRINGSAEPTVFQVRAVPTHLGFSVVYSYQHPFFINDIAITYAIDKGNNRLSGTWKVDHPPILLLKCDFAEVSQP